MTKIVAFTGHRPDKLPGGWNGDGGALCEWIEHELQMNKVDVVIVGGALGIDQIAMEAADNAGCYIILMEPFPAFWKKWPIARIEKYMHLKYGISDQRIKRRVIDKDAEYDGRKMQKRNEAMVNECNEVWAFHNGSAGGTANCVRYAEKVGKPVRNLFKEYNQ